MCPLPETQVQIQEVPVYIEKEVPVYYETLVPQPVYVYQPAAVDGQDDSDSQLAFGKF